MVSDVGCVPSSAFLYRTKRNLADAEALNKEVLAVRRQNLGTDHPDTWRITFNLALVYKLQHRLADAESLYRQTLEARRRVLGPQHPETLLTLDALGTVLIEEQRYAEAQPLLREVLDGRTKTAPTLWSTAATRSELGEALTRLHRLDEAEPLLLKSYDELSKQAASIPVANRIELKKACERLAFFYAERGDPSKSAELKHLAEGNSSSANSAAPAQARL